jgi:hypothetical protein
MPNYTPDLSAREDRPLFVITRSVMPAMDSTPWQMVPDTWAEAHLTTLDREQVHGEGEGSSPDGQRFRLYDGDGNLYFEGICWDDGSEEQVFAPLDWGAYDAGCTDIRYLVAAGKWETV